MPQSLSVGPFFLHFYGIFIGLGILASYLYSSRNSHMFGLTQKNIDNCFAFSLVFVLIGARLYHVFDQWGYYKTNVIEILSISNGGLGIFGVIAGGLVGLTFSAKIQKISLQNALNLIFPSLLLSQAIGRIGNFFNLEAYGPPTNLPWKIIINGEGVHPTFFYESVLCLSVFVIYLLLLKKNFKDLGFAFYLVSYGVIRLFTEFFRIGTWMINGIKLGWIFSVIMLITGLFLFLKKRESS